MAEKAEEEDDWWQQVWDDVKGGELKVKDVIEARKNVVDYMRKRGIWE